jgi:hypothetical protein
MRGKTFFFVAKKAEQKEQKKRQGEENIISSHHNARKIYVKMEFLCIAAETMCELNEYAKILDRWFYLLDSG